MLMWATNLRQLIPIILLHIIILLTERIITKLVSFSLMEEVLQHFVV